MREGATGKQSSLLTASKYTFTAELPGAKRAGKKLQQTVQLNVQQAYSPRFPIVGCKCGPAVSIGFSGGYTHSG